MKPLVTVIIPSYNHEKFIVESVTSVFNQTYSNIELIVIDDGSTDDSRKILTKLNERYDFKLVLKKNEGLPKTLNKAISISKGDYIVLCSSDDYLSKEMVEKQVEYLEKTKENVCYTLMRIVDDDGKEIKSQSNNYNKSLNNRPKFEDILNFRVVLPITYMMRKSFFYEVIGCYDQNISAEDYDISLKITLRESPFIIQEKLYNYRSPFEARKNKRRYYPMKTSTSESHRLSIEKYRWHREYENALQEWNFRKGVIFSSYKNTKLYALSGLLRSIRLFYRKEYIKSLVRFIVFWR
jgi:alpha-1,3-rhamnosyltransferase